MKKQVSHGLTHYNYPQVIRQGTW